MKSNKDAITGQPIHSMVSERIRTSILNGELKPGAFIRQQHIADKYGVSQISVREALKDLVSEGLVEHIPYCGVRVISYSLEDLSDLFALRAFIEGRTANTATKLITKAEIEYLSQLINEMKSAVEAEQFALYRELNRQFHLTIYQSSKSSFLIRTLEVLWSTYPTMLQGNFPQNDIPQAPDRNQRDFMEHSKIVDALERRDANAAESAMYEHIENAGKELLASLRESKRQEVPGKKQGELRLQGKLEEVNK